MTRDQAAACQMRMDAPTVLTGAQLHGCCQIIGKRHTGADRLAMKQSAVIAAHRLKGMGKGVPQIEKRPLARLAFIRLDNACLGPAGGGHSMRQRRVIARQHISAIRLQPFEGGIAKQPVFHHLGITGAKFTVGKRIEARHVGQHGARLVKGADQIAAAALTPVFPPTELST